MKTHSNPSLNKIILPAIIVLLALFAGLFFRDALYSAFATIASPFWTASETTSTALENQTVTKTKTELQNENQALRERLRRFSALEAERNALREQNEEFLNTLGRSGERELLAAGILAKPPVSPYDTFVVDVGRESGVSVGDAVYAYGNVRVGEIFQVSAQTAKVKLFSSPDETRTVLFGNENFENEIGGRGGGSFAAEIPSGIELSAGDNVYFPGLENDILGRIVRVATPENETFQQVYVQSPVDVFSLRMVQITR